MTIQEAYQDIIASLQNIYPPDEAANIADLVMERITDMDRSKRRINGSSLLGSENTCQLDIIKNELSKNRPVQYVLGEAWFMGMPFYVNESVLIPRPETEELVDWIINDIRGSKFPPSILDIGTGSGCIPVSLKKNLPAASVSAIDICEKALRVAERNAAARGTMISYFQLNILRRDQREKLPKFHVIVSNPPYITKQEMKLMNANVLNYEPHLALFVPDNDPLLFYRAIGEFASTHLHQGGRLYVEMHEDNAEETAELFRQLNFPRVEIRKDMQGKKRMCLCVKD
ncbi:MAG TPA: peptide chain release factor N(5)-glutamine methyltransferase [Parasegetibacter sp.]